MTSCRRLAIVLSHPVQYYSPWFRWLQANNSMEFRVFYLWDFGITRKHDPQFGTAFKWDIDLLTGYEYEFMPNVSKDPGTHHFRGLDNPQLGQRLNAWRPDAVLLFGYNWLSNLRTVFWAWRHDVPLILRGDSHLLGRPTTGLFRRTVLTLLFRKFSAFAYVGLANRDYYRAFGVPDARLFFSPHAVDSQLYDPSLIAHREAADRLRRDHGLIDRKVALFAGKFQPAKQPLALLRAFHQVAGKDDSLVFVGDGPLKAELIAEIDKRPDRHVVMLPFANQTEMPARYMMADIFALPSSGSYETWGLAVNEAMQLGVPCLVSDIVGCQRDLVLPGETGWVFTSGDQHSLTATLSAALRCSDEERARLRRNASARIAGYSYARAAAGLLEALQAMESQHT